MYRSQARSTRLLHDDFFVQAAETPERIALTFGESSIRYSVLAARAEQVASALQLRGIGQGALVGVHIERSIDWVIAMLGILRANAAIVPLPPSYPRARLQTIAEFATLDALLDSAASTYPGRPPAISLTLDTVLAESESVPSLLPGSPDQPAFVLSSSGSTGTPKMIVRSHGSFYHRLNWTWQNRPYAADEACVQKAHMTTTHSIYELFEPLLRGTRLTIMSDSEARDLDSFWSRLAEKNITRLLIVPSALQASLQMPAFTAEQIRVLVLMGEYVSPQLAQRALEAFPKSTALYSIYGSTEASSTLLCDLRLSFRPGAELPLGKPLSDEVQTYVLDEKQEPVARGAEGRLHIGGSALFSGYLNDARRTSAVLLDLADVAGPVYDTQDTVRLTADGSLEFVGRTDDTVKVRGFRVDLREVERTLKDQPGITNAAALIDDNAPGGARLVGFFAPANADRNALMRALQERLPDYMLPSLMLGVAQFPLTAQGKLDRQAWLGEVRNSVSAPATAEFTEDEQRIASIWSDVLGHRQFDAGSSFFEVGGTSLSVFSLVLALREVFDLDDEQLPGQSIYRCPTIAGQAALIADPDAAVDATVPLLVTMRRGTNPDRPPLFFVAAAGGTLGAYEKLAEALEYDGDILGLRDPYIWGERPATEPFADWAQRYVTAITDRQPVGPYRLCAYSSAGAFGIEVAQQLTRAGHDVRLLALIDTLALSRHGERSFGFWALRATYMRPVLRQLVRLVGWARVPWLKLTGNTGQGANDFALSPFEAESIATKACSNPQHLQSVAALLELNTGQPFSLSAAAFENVDTDEAFDVFRDKVLSIMPDIDAATLQRIVEQYEMQIRTQHAYRFAPYAGRTLLIEPKSPYAGLVAANLRPFFSKLETRVAALGAPDEHTRQITARFGALEAHYRSMRDATFVAAVARELHAALD
jgi:enterobactin synthetase component F